MTWKPAKTTGLAAGLMIGIMLVAMLFMIIDSLRQQTPSLGTALSALLMALVILSILRWGLHFTSLLILQYRLDRNGVIIRYGPAQHTVPLDHITDIVPGHQLVLSNTITSSIWPGYISRQIAWDPTRPLWVHGTSPLDQQIVLMTDRAMYAISPANPERFIEDVYRRRALGAVRQVNQSTNTIGVAAWDVWQDRYYWLAILLGLLLNLGVFTIAASVHGQTPADTVPSRLGLLLLPSIGGGVLVLNVMLSAILYHWERLATWLLLVVAILVQPLLGLMALRAFW